MAKDKKVEQITDMEVDFAQWFTDVCIKAELVDYSGVKGLFILRPYGYAIWEDIQSWLDRRFKELGHENVSMPLLIPESLLQKEKDHVEGFAPECAWVTLGGSEELPDWEAYAERLLISHMFYNNFPHVGGTSDGARAFYGLAAVYAFVKFVFTGNQRRWSGREEMADILAGLFRLIEHSDFKYRASQAYRRQAEFSPGCWRQLVSI